MGYSLDGNGGWKISHNWIPTEGQLKSQGDAAKDWKAAYAAVDTLEQLKKFANSADYNGSKYILAADISKPLNDGQLAVGEDNFVFLNETTNDFEYGDGPEGATNNGTNSIFGNSLENKIKGSAVNDRIQAGDGDDDVSGLDGNDEIWGGRGNDWVRGGDGEDVVYGQEGNDQLEGGGGNDLLLGGSGNDDLYGSAGDDEIFGGTGNDTLSGGDGNDTFYLSELSGSGTKISDFGTNGDADKLFIIDKSGKKSDYSFKQKGDDVVIQKGSTVIGTILNAKADDVEKAAEVGASQYEAAADEAAGQRRESRNGGNLQRGLDDIKDLKKSDKVTGTFEIGSTSTNIQGFAYSAGHRIKFSSDVDPSKLTVLTQAGKVTVKDGDKELAVITPPKGTRDDQAWRDNVVKALKEAGVKAENIRGTL